MRKLFSLLVLFGLFVLSVPASAENCVLSGAQGNKYPFRDAYSSQPTEDLDLVAIVLNCLQSLK